jgi:hypothetical protein
MPHRKARPKPDDEQIRALHQRAEVARRRSDELIRQMKDLADEIAGVTEQPQDGSSNRNPTQE